MWHLIAKNLSIFCSSTSSYEIKSITIKNSNSNYTFQLPSDLISPLQIFRADYSSGFEGASSFKPDSGGMGIFHSDLYSFFQSWGESFENTPNMYNTANSTVKANTATYTCGAGIIYYKTNQFSSSYENHYILVEYIKNSHSIKITQESTFYFQGNIYKNYASQFGQSNFTESGYFTSALSTTPFMSFTYVV